MISHQILSPIPASIPKHVASFPIVFPMLKHMLSLCRERWIRDFLFTTDPAHLTALTAPLLTAHALTCDVSLTRFQTTNAKAHRQHLDASFVFVPAFSISHISVGFGIQENRNTSTQGLQDFVVNTIPDRSVRQIEQFRYVRDDNMGIVTMVHDFAQDGYFRVEYMAHQSSICRLRSFCHIEHNALLNAVNGTDAALEAEKLFPAVSIFQSVHEYRDCPMCGATVTSPCACKLDIVAPSHSFDFKNGGKHMSSHVGAFQGIANLQLFAKGAALKQVQLGSRIHVQGGTAPDLVTRLTKWAISEHLKDVRLDPLESLLPSTSSGVDNAHAESGKLDSAELSLGNSTLDVDHVLDRALLDGLLDTHLQDCHELDSGTAMPSLVDPVELEQWQTATAIDALSGFFQASTQEHSGVLLQEGDAQMLDLDVEANSKASKHMSTSISNSSLPGWTPLVHLGQNGIGVDAVESSIYVPPTELMSCSPVSGDDDSHAMDTTADHINHDALGGGKNEGEDDDMREAPSMPRQGNEPIITNQTFDTLEDADRAQTPEMLDENSGTSPSIEIDEKERLKELKKILKRERNRASARRSNAKKKIENDQRKRERKRLKDLEIRLRDEEQRLRHENLLLRKELHAQGVALV